MPAQRFTSNAPPATIRLVSRITQSPDGPGCWLTDIAPSSGGRYPYISDRNKLVRVCRMVLELKLGRALLPGEVARHTCDNTLCVRMDHIVEGSQGDNNRDRDSRGRLARDARTGRYIRPA